MKELVGNLWDYHDQGEWIAITTNGAVTKAGMAVMGRGVALEARLRYAHLPISLGYRLKKYGNHVMAFPDIRILTFPVKHVWKHTADAQLIARSRDELLAVACAMDLRAVYMVRPGCGNGGLNWNYVRELIKFLPDWFFVVEQAGDPVVSDSDWADK